MKKSPFFEAHQWLDELEDAVSQTEIALEKLAWSDLHELTDQQRRLTHGLINAVDQVEYFLPHDRQLLDQRIHKIIHKRASQIRRLKHFRDAVGIRLRQIYKFKHALKSVTEPSQPVAVDVER